MYVDEKREGELLTPSLPGFISWLEQQDQSATYNWTNCRGCACDQYAKSIGAQFVMGQPLWNRLNFLATPRPFAKSSDTFGNLLARARDALLEL